MRSKDFQAKFGNCAQTQQMTQNMTPLFSTVWSTLRASFYGLKWNHFSFKTWQLWLRSLSCPISNLTKLFWKCFMINLKPSLNVTLRTEMSAQEDQLHLIFWESSAETSATLKVMFCKESKNSQITWRTLQSNKNATF